MRSCAVVVCFRLHAGLNKAKQTVAATSKSKPKEVEEEGESAKGVSTEQAYIRYLEDAVTALGGDLQFGKGKEKATG